MKKRKTPRGAGFQRVTKTNRQIVRDLNEFFAQRPRPWRAPSQLSAAQRRTASAKEKRRRDRAARIEARNHVSASGRAIFPSEAA